MGINLRGASAQERARYATLVRPARLSHALSQLELATIAGVDRTTVSNVERGAGSPQSEVLRRLLGALGIATDDAHDDLELELWSAMLESLLLAVPAHGRAEAADAALATIAEHVRVASASEAPASIPRIVDPVRRDHGTEPLAAKRGAARRDARHAD